MVPYVCNNMHPYNVTLNLVNTNYNDNFKNGVPALFYGDNSLDILSAMPKYGYVVMTTILAVQHLMVYPVHHLVPY